MSDSIGLGVVGTGDWGANLIRNFAALPGAALAALCDADPKRLAVSAARYPQAAAHALPEELAGRSDVQGVVIAASAVSHFDLARLMLVPCVQVGQHRVGDVVWAGWEQQIVAGD